MLPRHTDAEGEAGSQLPWDFWSPLESCQRDWSAAVLRHTFVSFCLGTCTGLCAAARPLLLHSRSSSVKASGYLKQHTWFAWLKDYLQPACCQHPGQHPGEQSKALCEVLFVVLGTKEWWTPCGRFYISTCRRQRQHKAKAALQERSVYLTGRQQSICALSSAGLRTSMRGSRLKAKHPKPHPGLIRKEGEENIVWKRKGMAFSRIYTYFFIFRISKCQPSFSKVDLPTKKAILLLLVLLLFYFHYCPGSLSWVPTKQCWSRVHCWYPVTGVLHAGQYRGKHRETLCEHWSYTTSQILPGISPAPWSQGRKWKCSAQTLTPQRLSWHPETQEHRAAPSHRLMCRIILLCYRSCKKQMYVE